MEAIPIYYLPLAFGQQPGPVLWFAVKYNYLVLLLTLMAFCKLMRLLQTTTVNWLNRTISCTSTVFMLCVAQFQSASRQPHPPSHVLTWLHTVGYFLNASSVSNCFGNLVKISLDTCWRILSLDLARPELIPACVHAYVNMVISLIHDYTLSIAFTWVSKMLSNSWLVSCWSLVMSALACIPNTFKWQGTKLGPPKSLQLLIINIID